MDPIELSVISAVLGSQFYVVYRLGKIEQKLKDICNFINNSLNNGDDPCRRKRSTTGKSQRGNL